MPFENSSFFVPESTCMFDLWRVQAFIKALIVYRTKHRYNFTPDLFVRLIFFWQGYAPACHCDGIVEVVGLQGVMHLVKKMFYIIFSFTYWLNLVNIWLREEDSGLEIKRARVAIKQTSRIRGYVYWTVSNLSSRFCLFLLYFKAFRLLFSLYSVLATVMTKSIGRASPS